MDDELTFSDALVTSFIKCHHKAGRSPVSAQRDLPIPEACHDFIFIPYRNLRFGKERLASLRPPMAWYSAKPRQAGLLVFRVWLQAVDHRLPPMMSSSSPSASF